MSRRTGFAHWALIAVIAMPILTACQAPPLQIRPVGGSLASAQMGVEREDADYASARVAIEHRDYATALEWLQSARSRNPSDVRVLNAFGVVYDKLGRFDLSARYYQQALEIDRSSTIVQHNLAYSRSLQSRIVSSPVSWELADIQPLPQVTVQPVPQPAAVATATPRPRHTLTVVNSTGRVGGETPVFEHLVGLKWSLSHRQVQPGVPVRITTIRYAAACRNQAIALARTLPGHVQMVLVDGDETGVRLVLGTDTTSWHLASPSRG